MKQLLLWQICVILEPCRSLNRYTICCHFDNRVRAQEDEDQIHTQLLETWAIFISSWGYRKVFRLYILAHRADSIETRKKPTVPCWLGLLMGISPRTGSIIWRQVCYSTADILPIFPTTLAMIPPPSFRKNNSTSKPTTSSSERHTALHATKYILAPWVNIVYVCVELGIPKDSLIPFDPHITS